METRLFKINSPNDTELLREAAQIINDGGLVAIPTETVYGLAANALDGAAVEKIFAAKGRPQDNPLIVHISELDELPALVREVPEKAMKLANAFWPGPLTMILPKADIIPSQVSCSLPTVAVRMPGHEIARAFIKAAGVPLAAPSANLSGKPSPTTAQHVLHDMNGKIDAIIDGGECAVGVESTVITLCQRTPRLLRPGGVTLSQIHDVIGEIDADKAIFSMLPDDAQVASPGMKYKHYAPNADVVIVKGTLDDFSDYVRHCRRKYAVVCFDGEEQHFTCPAYSFGKQHDSSAQAHRIFDILRRIDDTELEKVFVRCPDLSGVGMAVYNRLLRAAEFEIVEL